VADLLTHLATVYVPTRLGVKNPGARSLAYLGVCLPDLLSRAGSWMQRPGTLSFHDVVHTPAFLALTALAASQLFARGLRLTSFLTLFLGGLVHLVVDAAKDYLGSGGVMWAFPWTLRRWEWGLFLPEHTVYFMAPALLAIVLARTVGRARDPLPAPDSGAELPDRPGLKDAAEQRRGP
jgi:hypothetical protein